MMIEQIQLGNIAEIEKRKGRRIPTGSMSDDDDGGGNRDSPTSSSGVGWVSIYPREISSDFFSFAKSKDEEACCSWKLLALFSLE